MSPFRERVAAFGRSAGLAGVITHPMGGATRIPALILGAGIIHKIGPSRIAVELARHLAGLGHPSLRFDLSGIGDSPRAAEVTLQEAVVADISDAIDYLLEQTGGHKQRVCLIGFCSGADNAFFVAADDPRVETLVLYDPTIHRTSGFGRRKLVERVTSGRSWWNVLSGNGLRQRDSQATRQQWRPPDYYGLLVSSPEEADARARKLVARDVRSLYVLGRGVWRYCNSPEQVEESMPTGFARSHMTILWRPDFDHILSTPRQRKDLCDAIGHWLGEVSRARATPATRETA